MAADITSILEHLGESIDPVTSAVQVIAYLVGFMMVWQSIKKLKTIADQRAKYTTHGKMFIPLAYFLGGVSLFFLPTMVDIAKNTFFGVGSPIAYDNWVEQLREKYGDGSIIVPRLVQLAGLIWFIRGIVLLSQSSEPGVQHGSKGLVFLVAGILAVNIHYTYELMAKLVTLITSI